MDVKLWHSWRDFHLHKFSVGRTFMNTKGNQSTAGKKGIVAVCLSIRELTKTIDDVLDEALKSIQQSRAHASLQPNTETTEEDQLDAIAMFGHRIGMLETSKELAAYFKDGCQLMPPYCQIIFSSFGASTMDNYRQSRRQGISNGHDTEGAMELRFGDLLGPYFGIFQVDIAIFEAQVALTPWQLHVMFIQDCFIVNVSLLYIEARLDTPVQSHKMHVKPQHEYRRAQCPDPAYRRRQNKHR